MIKVIIFDLDGTLIQTEVLKARSYARAIHTLTKKAVAEEKVLAGFAKFVGLSRMEVVQGLTTDFQEELKGIYQGKNQEFLQQSILSKRLEIYKNMIEETHLLSQFFCPYNLGLLQALHDDNFMIALATMSHMNEAEKMLNALKIKDKFRSVITRDSVSNGKPHPEIYLKSRDTLKVKSEECLVIEDSVNGIKAGLNADMNVFAVTNDITRDAVHASKLLSDDFIVDDLTELKPRVYQFLSDRRN
jgi:beta-phosphoglucomutase-like phosphatase (HAD superfamily)